MPRLNGWKKLKRVPQELAEGDKFYGIWEKEGSYLFIVDDNFGEYIIGKKGRSQMDELLILARASNLRMAKRKALKYIKG